MKFYAFFRKLGFKKAPAEEKKKLFGSLLKKYQNVPPTTGLESLYRLTHSSLPCQEIDALTRRSQFAEKEFLLLYKNLSNAPDPAPLLVLAGQEIERVRACWLPPPLSLCHSSLSLSCPCPFPPLLSRYSALISKCSIPYLFFLPCFSSLLAFSHLAQQ